MITVEICQRGDAKAQYYIGIAERAGHQVVSTKSHYVYHVNTDAAYIASDVSFKYMKSGLYNINGDSIEFVNE